MISQKFVACTSSADAESKANACLASAYSVVAQRNDEGEARSEQNRLFELAKIYSQVASTMRREGK